MSGTPSVPRSVGRASVITSPSTSPAGYAGGPAGGAGGPIRGRAAPGRPGLPGTVRRGRRPRWGRILLVFGVGLLVLALAAGGGAWWWLASVNNDIERTDPFAGITGDRPDKVVE